MSLFFGVPVDLAYHLVGWIAAILAPLTGGLATAAAIIAFTMLARLLLLPLSYFAVRGSVRGEGARARLQPKIAELRRRHAKDPQRLQAELGTLYRAEGSGMFGGCLPLLLQVINSQPVTDANQKALVSELTTWKSAGATLTPTAAVRPSSSSRPAAGTRPRFSRRELPDGLAKSGRRHPANSEPAG